MIPKNFRPYVLIGLLLLGSSDLMSGRWVLGSVTLLVGGLLAIGYYNDRNNKPEEQQ